jgi:RND family efflux transporter MFP subunit
MRIGKLLSHQRGAAFGLIVGGLVVWAAPQVYKTLTPAHRSMPGKVAAATESLPTVTVIEPEHRPGMQTITLPASVDAIEKATLYAKVSGYVQRIRVDKGDRVRKGEVLAQLEVPEVEKEYQSAEAAVAESQAEYERAETDAGLKQLTYQRTKGVRDSEPSVISPQQVDVAHAASDAAAGSARLARANLDKARAELGRLQVLTEFARIKAPFDGMVTERFVDSGALIQAGLNASGNPVVTVASMDQVRVYVSVPEVDVSQVTRGTAAKVQMDAFPGRQLSGKVTRFADAVDPQSRTMKTEIDLPNPGHRILPGMFGRVVLDLSTDPNALFLPDQVIRQDSTNHRFIYTVEEGRLRKAAIQTGQDDGIVTQVFGLRGDEAAVFAGAESLGEGTPVRSLKQANASGGH